MEQRRESVLGCPTPIERVLESFSGLLDEPRLNGALLALLGAQAVFFAAAVSSGNIPPAVLSLFRALLTL